MLHASFLSTVVSAWVSDALLFSLLMSLAVDETACVWAVTAGTPHARRSKPSESWKEVMGYAACLAPPAPTHTVQD
jgi:hypothetical protein